VVNSAIEPKRSGKLNVERVDETKSLAGVPGTGQQAGEWMSLGRRHREGVQSDPHSTSADIAGAVEAADR
jgi:hypothetical protein